MTINPVSLLARLRLRTLSKNFKRKLKNQFRRPNATPSQLPVKAASSSVVAGNDVITVSRFLIPNAHKLYDFRNEPGFAETATRVLGEGRTYLQYDRLLVLWQAVQNTLKLNHSVMEVGVFRGGSTQFLADSFGYYNRRPKIYAFDTFSGLPAIYAGTQDGPNVTGHHGNTDYASVKKYLSRNANVSVTQGIFPESAGDAANDIFSLIHLDVDLEKSVAVCLDYLWPRLCNEGVIVIDDYGYMTCRGLKQAVDVFVHEHSDCAGWYMHTGQYVVEKRRI